ncbi:MAG: tetratricopeptide repeat protein [Pirellulales bacterium]|nr:tetratricopeptide repeat protein [Pirellulales bacterium]
MEPYEISNLIEEAASALERKDYERVIAVTDQFVEIVPDDAVVRIMRAEALLKSDAGQDAFDEARRAAELAPASIEAQTLLGLAGWRYNRLSAAQQAMERAISLSGRKSRLLIDYAWFMASERGPRPAEEAAREAIEANPDASTAWAALGMAQFRLHRFQEAEESLKRALRLDPNDPYAQAAMAELLHNRRHDRQALALTRLLEDTPGTESVIQSIRTQAKQRQLAGKLVERAAWPTPYRVTMGSTWLWIVLWVFLSACAALMFQPRSALAITMCLAVPLLVVWVWRKLVP